MILKVIFFIVMVNIYYVLFGAILLMGFIALGIGGIEMPDDYDKWNKRDKALCLYKLIIDFPIQVVRIIIGIS